MENKNEEYENIGEIYEETPIEMEAVERLEAKTVQFVGCAKHNDLPFIGECLSCGKQLCRECRDERGYFCSDECRERSRSTVDTAAKKEFQQNLASSERIAKIVKICALIVVSIILINIACWIYSEFFDPAGTLVWQWKVSPPTDDLFLIGHENDKAFVKRESSVICIDLKTGKEVSSDKNKVLDECTEFVQRTVAGGALLRGKKSIVMLSAEGKLAWSKRFENQIDSIVIAEGDAVLVVTKPERDFYKKTRAEDICYELTVFDIQNGGRRWKKEYDNFVYLYDVVASRGKFVQSVSKIADKKYESYLEVCDLKTAKPLWRIKSERAVSSSLIIIGNIMMFKIKNTLSAVDLKSAKKLWKMPMKGWAWKRNIKKEGNNILINNGEIMTFIDAKNGKKLWEKPIPDYLNSTAYADGKIYSIVLIYEEAEEEEVQKVKLPPAFDQLKDFDTLSAIRPTSTKSRGKNEGYLVCQDMTTGEDLWKVKSVRGNCVAGDGKLLVINDTSRMTLLNLSNEGLGSILIRQFNPENGKELFQRSNPTGLVEPYFIVGDKLIGMEYERVKGGIGGIMGQDQRLFGMAAFQLK